MNIRKNRQQSGSTLAVVIATMAILMVIVGVAIEYTTSVNRNVQRTTTYLQALAIGDSAIDVLFNNWRVTCRNPVTNVPLALTSNSFTAVAMPSPFPNLTNTNFVKRGAGLDPTNDGDYDPTYTISNYKVIAVDAEYQALPNITTTPKPQLGQIGPGVAPTPGVNTSATYNYVASADVTLDWRKPAGPGASAQSNVVARVRRVFQKQMLWPWNWAIFYVDPLEIHPGPLFTVTGWVHTNADLYTAHSTLTFADKVTYAGDWFVKFMPGDGGHNGDTIAPPHYPAGLPPARDQAMQPFGLDSSQLMSGGNPNDDSYRELIEPPSAGADPLAYARYWNQAGVAIKIDASNNITIGTPNSDGTITSLGPPSSGPDTRTTAQKNLYTMFSGAITTNQSIQDNREGASTRLATLDVSQIESADTSANGVKYKASNFNGIVYIYDQSGTSTTHRGIRIKNGTKIPVSPTSGATGLTVVSNNAVYMQGDFNTGGTGSVVPSNNPVNLNADGTYITPSSPPSPQVIGYTRAPTSILADAVNVLSNAWKDTNAQSGDGLDQRIASPTTVNTAIVAGTVATNTYGDLAYSGGAENFPRFLEDWSTKPLTYYGSMVQMYKSMQSIGEWGKANVYSPPTRAWYFDTNFKITPPPGSLMLYSYVKGRWYVL